MKYINMNGNVRRTIICWLLALGIFFIVFDIHAQTSPSKEVHDREQAWIGFFTQVRWTNKVGLWADVHYRRTDRFLDRSFQFMIRSAFTYYLKDHLRLHAGYLYAHHFPTTYKKTARPEHRPWQQIWWNQKYNGYTTIQYLRFEQRFNQKISADDKLLNDYRFNFRLRYNFSLFVPLTRKELLPKTPFLALIDEVFINFGEEIKYNYFDQNRFFVGLGYQYSAHGNVQLGYMNLFQQEASGYEFINNHVIRLFITHNLDFSKKE